MSTHDQSTVADLVQRIRARSRPLEPRPTGLAPRVQRLPDIRAVLFDVYGTLFISASGDIAAGELDEDTQAFRMALHEAGLSGPVAEGGVPGPEAMLDAIRASHARSHERGIEYPEVDILAIWREVLSGLGGAVSEQALRVLAVEYECRVNAVWPMPGADQTLKTLGGRGLSLGIVSNAQFYTPLMFQALLGASPAALGFAPEHCAWSYERGEAKPATDLFQRVLGPLEAHHGIAPAQVLYVGNDRLKDIWPAASLGCRTALFAGDRRSLRLREGDGRCAATEPDLIITDLRDLTGI